VQVILYFTIPRCIVRKRRYKWYRYIEVLLYWLPRKIANPKPLEELASEDLEHGASLSLLEDMFSRLRVPSLKVDQRSEKVIPEIQHWKQRELEISLDVTCRRLMQVDEAFGRITYRAAFFISAMGDQNQT
jgi:hypothetical protein